MSTTPVLDGCVDVPSSVVFWASAFACAATAFQLLLNLWGQQRIGKNRYLGRILEYRHCSSAGFSPSDGSPACNQSTACTVDESCLAWSIPKFTNGPHFNRSTTSTSGEAFSRTRRRIPSPNLFSTVPSMPTKVRPHAHRRPSSSATAREATVTTGEVPSTPPQEAGLCTLDYLSRAVEETISELFPEITDAPSLVTPATKPEFGDYQCNAAMPLAKRLPIKTPPREIATRMAEALQPRLKGVVSQISVAGPGFLNLSLDDAFLRSTLEAALASPRLAVPKSPTPQRVVVDFSSPNIAKEMHVGHLRSTIIGDTLARTLEFRGHNVLRLNHVGDWGTQFGMLITHLREVAPGTASIQTTNCDDTESLPSTPPPPPPISDLVEFYKAAKQRFDVSEEFRAASLAAVVDLQSGDAATLASWNALCEVSRREFQNIYDRLDVALEERGESFYNPLLAGVVADLEAKGVAVESEGATCVFPEGFTARDGNAQPLIVRKSDGGFLYATTDLAAIQHRVQEERADRILYVTDAGQSQHFEMVFATARQSSICPASVSLEHVPFGLVLGEDGKKFKTRSGETVKLKDLLDEAVEAAKRRAASDHEDTGDSPESTGGAEGGGGATADDSDDVARVVGISAVKFADLSLNRESNYRFSFNKMLALTGNTAPYLLYAYARIRGIQRKAEAQGIGANEGDDASLAAANIILEDKAEVALGTALARFSEVVVELEHSLFPNKLCDYLYALSQTFNQFYENCSVLKAEDDATARSRAALCELTARTLETGMQLLGIPVLDQI